MSETKPYHEAEAEMGDKYKYVRDPNYYRSEDAFRARFVDVEKAIATNPEKRGTASAILAACYMAFGAERVDLKKLGPDVLLPRLNGFLVAYNDQVDLAEKIKETDPDVYEVIMNHVAKYRDKFEEYFQPTGDEQEDKRRQEFKKFYDLGFGEVDAVEHELFNVQKTNDPAISTSELKRVQQGRELVNAIEMLINIRACVPGLYSDRMIDQEGPKDIAGLAKKYDWIIDPDYDDSELTDDEKKARMMFFATMSAQSAMDEIDYKEDRLFDIWKKMTYMTEAQKIPPERAIAIMKEDAMRYAMLSEQYGMSPLPTILANKGSRALLRVRNLALYRLPDFVQNKLVKRAENSGHIREKAIALLQKKHPGKYKT